MNELIYCNKLKNLIYDIIHYFENANVYWQNLKTLQNKFVIYQIIIVNKYKIFKKAIKNC